jgi:carboxypeptidase Q
MTLRALLIGTTLAAVMMAPAIAQTIPRAPAAALIAAGLKDDKAYELTRDLTTENGPRLAGSAAEARARDWAIKRLTAEGFTGARVDPFSITYWGRLRESADILGPFGQRLDVHAAGGSAGTPEGGIEGDIVRFADMAALRENARLKPPAVVQLAALCARLAPRNAMSMWAKAGGASKAQSLF